MKPLTFLLLLGILPLFGCKSDTTGPSKSGNLIPNSTFEVNGIPSLQGWVCDTSYFHLSYDIPPMSTGYSVRLKPDDKPSVGRLSLKSVPVGKHIFRLSCWGKGFDGDFFFEIYSNKIYSLALRIHPKDSIWTHYAVEDTIKIDANASFTIGILTPYSGFTQSSSYYHAPTLEILD
jgi:hypothetical protein